MHPIESEISYRDKLHWIFIHQDHFKIIHQNRQIVLNRFQYNIQLNVIISVNESLNRIFVAMEHDHIFLSTHQRDLYCTFHQFAEG